MSVKLQSIQLSVSACLLTVKFEPTRQTKISQRATSYAAGSENWKRSEKLNLKKPMDRIHGRPTAEGGESAFLIKCHVLENMFTHSYGRSLFNTRAEDRAARRPHESPDEGSRSRTKRQREQSECIHIKCGLIHCSWKVETRCVSGKDPKQRWRQFSIPCHFNQQCSLVIGLNILAGSADGTLFDVYCGQYCIMTYCHMLLQMWLKFASYGNILCHIKSTLHSVSGCKVVATEQMTLVYSCQAKINRVIKHYYDKTYADILVLIWTCVLGLSADLTSASSQLDFCKHSTNRIAAVRHKIHAFAIREFIHPVASSILIVPVLRTLTDQVGLVMYKPHF